MLQAYFDQIIAALVAAPWVDTLHPVRFDRLEIEEERILVYRIRANLTDGGLIEISERLVFSPKSQNVKITMYRFHWQDRSGALVKRWDNAPHHTEVDTHPDHIHLGAENHIIAGDYVSAQEIIFQIDEQLSDKG